MMCQFNDKEGYARCVHGDNALLFSFFGGNIFYEDINQHSETTKYFQR